MPMRPRTVAFRSALARDASRIITAEFHHDLTLVDVAARIATSRRQLQRAYEEAGTSFTRELTGTRMRAAAYMLRRPGDWHTIREVAHAVGYRQPAQFAKAFRRYHGVNPTQYVEGHRGR